MSLNLFVRHRYCFSDVLIRYPLLI